MLGGYRATRSLLIAQTEKLVNPANLGLAYGFIETVSGFALLVAPPVAGALYSKDPQLIFSIPLILILPLVVISIFWRRMPWIT